MNIFILQQKSLFVVLNENKGMQLIGEHQLPLVVNYVKLQTRGGRSKVRGLKFIFHKFKNKNMIFKSLGKHNNTHLVGSVNDPDLLATNGIRKIKCLMFDCFFVPTKNFEREKKKEKKAKCEEHCQNNLRKVKTN